MGRVRTGAVAGALAAAVVAALAAAPAGQGEVTAGESPFVIGTVIQRDLERDEGRLIQAGGISSVRLWISWASVEDRELFYDWSRPDAVIEQVVEDGLTPLPYLFGTPTWAAKFDGYDCVEGECASYAPVSYVTRSAFARFAAAAVRRYGPDGQFWDDHPQLPYRPVRRWQLWNEPNLQSFYQPYANPSGYAELVRRASAGIREADPGAEILLGGMFGNRSTSKRLSTQSYLRQLYAAPGIAGSFDGVAVHPYSTHTSGVLKQVATAHTIVAKRDPDADLWITELGWASAGDRTEWGLIKSPRGQATVLRRSFSRLIDRAAAWNLRGAYWYAWRDTDRRQAVCGWCAAAGLRDRWGGPKPAFTAMRRLAAELP